MAHRAVKKYHTSFETLLPGVEHVEDITGADAIPGKYTFKIDLMCHPCPGSRAVGVH